mmetsp:Transcript_15479/g.46472  ORF Transcript_15479/g.46472 Transcript_15479/m.46472 type:complete len:295 (-) Transcript_15479:629-1513(-)
MRGLPLCEVHPVALQPRRLPGRWDEHVGAGRRHRQPEHVHQHPAVDDLLRYGLPAQGVDGHPRAVREHRPEHGQQHGERRGYGADRVQRGLQHGGVRHARVPDHDAVRRHRDPAGEGPLPDADAGLLLRRLPDDDRHGWHLALLVQHLPDEAHLRLGRVAVASPEGDQGLPPLGAGPDRQVRVLEGGEGLGAHGDSDRRLLEPDPDHLHLLPRALHHVPLHPQALPLHAGLVGLLLLLHAVHAPPLLQGRLLHDEQDRHSGERPLGPPAVGGGFGLVPVGHPRPCLRRRLDAGS